METFVLILKGVGVLGLSGFAVFWLWNYALWRLSPNRYADKEWNAVFERTLEKERKRIRKEERERLKQMGL